MSTSVSSEHAISNEDSSIDCFSSSTPSRIDLACFFAFFSSSNFNEASNASSSRRSISSFLASISAASCSDIASNESGISASNSSFTTISPTIFFGGSKTLSMIPSRISSSFIPRPSPETSCVFSFDCLAPTASPKTSDAFLTLSLTAPTTFFTCCLACETSISFTAWAACCADSINLSLSIFLDNIFSKAASRSFLIRTSSESIALSIFSPSTFEPELVTSGISTCDTSFSPESSFIILSSSDCLTVPFVSLLSLETKLCSSTTSDNASCFLEFFPNIFFGFFSFFSFGSLTSTASLSSASTIILASGGYIIR